MKLSVIVPVFNEEKYIEKCLNSIVNQKIKADEVIVVDNNCTDTTISIAKQYPVKIIKEERQGLIYARNAGFNYASGDIIARTDADTIVPPDWIKRIRQFFEKTNNYDGFTGPVQFYDLFFINSHIFPYLIYFYSLKIFCGYKVFAGPNMILTKKIWNKIKNEVCLNDKQVHEDIDLSIHLSKYGRIFFDKKFIVSMSARRIKNNPVSFMAEYPLRIINTLKTHKQK